MRRYVRIAAICWLASAGVTAVAAVDVPPQARGESALEESERLIGEWNAEIARTDTSESWTKTALGTACHFFAGCGGLKMTVTVEMTDERLDSADVTVVCNGLLNDSTQGTRTRALLAREGDGKWMVRRVDVMWNCWPGRGHEYWGRDPCR